MLRGDGFGARSLPGVVSVQIRLFFRVNPCVLLLFVVCHLLASVPPKDPLLAGPCSRR